MRYIQKEAEPPFFSEWKRGTSPDWNPDWAAFDSNGQIKRDLMGYIADEQGGICCYCNCELRDGDFHIEHFRPKDSDRYPELDLEYENLLISCQRTLERRESRHCGMRKGNWFEEGITVSPLKPDCETRFEYFGDGSIEPASDDQGAGKTINHLGLDIDRLNKLRSSAISAALEDVDIFEDDVLREQINIFRQRSPVTNRFQPFCVSIVQVLLGLLDG